MQFFIDGFKFRKPRSASEGALKGYLYGGFIMCVYDALSSPPLTTALQFNHSVFIVEGYALAIALGALIGVFHNTHLENNIQNGNRSVQLRGA